MRESLRALLVDDNPDDRALVARELTRAFPGLVAEHAVNPTALAQSLQDGHFDLVITDYQLCWTDGLTVLQQVKERWPECPVVMFTGTGSEEIAVRAMKAGLDDYVLKSTQHFARLPAVVKTVLKLRHQKNQLREAEARYGTLFATVPVGLYRATPDGKILDANPALVELLRYPNPAALVGINVGSLYSDKAEYERWRALMKRDGLVQHFETRLRTRDGELCWVDLNARAVYEPHTKRLIYEGSLENIDERKRAEEEREHLIEELQEALAKVKTLSGLLPICASCKKIRDDKGYWNQIEAFIQTHSDAEFTHSFCPDCIKSLYPELFAEEAKLGS